MIRDLMEQINLNEQSTMFYWYPKIKDLPIPQPKTLSYRFTDDEKEFLANDQYPSSIAEKIRPLADEIGYPLFMRTDNSSCKHFWNKTCYVPSVNELSSHVMELLSNSAMQGWMSYNDNGIFVREFIPLVTKFTAFYGKFPVNKERRYFIKNGMLQCHHPYWYPPAIMQPSTDDFQGLLSYLNYEREAEIKKLTKLSEIVGKIFDGYWSVDFAYGKDHRWYLFDMARGEQSFHWLECPYCPDEMKEQYTEKEEKAEVKPLDSKLSEVK